MPSSRALVQEFTGCSGIAPVEGGPIGLAKFTFTADARRKGKKSKAKRVVEADEPAQHKYVIKRGDKVLYSGGDKEAWANAWADHWASPERDQRVVLEVDGVVTYDGAPPPPNTSVSKHVYTDKRGPEWASKKLTDKDDESPSKRVVEDPDADSSTAG